MENLPAKLPSRATTYIPSLLQNGQSTRDCNEYVSQNGHRPIETFETNWQSISVCYEADYPKFGLMRDCPELFSAVDPRQYSPSSRCIDETMDSNVISAFQEWPISSVGNDANSTGKILNPNCHRKLFGCALCRGKHNSSCFVLPHGNGLPPPLMSSLKRVLSTTKQNTISNSFGSSSTTTNHTLTNPSVTFDPRQTRSAVFSITTSIILLLALLQPPVAAAMDLSSGEFHPSQVLSSSSPVASREDSSSHRISSKFATAGSEVKEDEVLHHLYRNGRNKEKHRKPSVTFMVELFNDLQRGGTLGYSNRVEPVTDTVRSFSGRNSRRSRKGKRTVDFHVPYLPQHETLRVAEIRFLRRKSRKPAFRRFRFRIDVRTGGKIVKKLTFRESSKTQFEYNVFDVTPVVKPWINNHHGNVSLHIRVSRKLRQHLLLSNKDKTAESTSLIVLYLEDKEFLKNMYASFTKGDEKATEQGSSPSSSATASSSSSSSSSLSSSELLVRRKRAASLSPSLPSASSQNQLHIQAGTSTALLSRHEREARTRRIRNRKVKSRRYRPGRRENCRMYDFHVDFQIIGWGQWIIHPKQFNSKFCFGQCPSPIEAKYHPTNHAMLQTLMRMSLPNVAPSPCCVPTMLKPVSMLYLEYDEVVVRSHEDMIVEQCGCR